MTNSQVHPEGWISVLIEQKHEERAKQIRRERDRKYGNIYATAATDERWVGDLGELVFNSWFKHEKIKGFKWVLEDVAGKADFITPLNITIGVKTVKRKVQPRTDYTAQITAHHAKEPVDQFFFMTYEIDKRQMWLLGGIDRTRFLREAIYYGANEFVHSHYQIREGHEIYNIDISKLISPKDWIAQVT